MECPCPCKPQNCTLANCRSVASFLCILFALATDILSLCAHCENQNKPLIMNSNSPFNMPRQVSPILKTPTYAGCVSIPDNSSPQRAGPPPVKTHYSSPIEASALSVSFSEYKAIPTPASAEKASPLSFYSKGADSGFKKEKGNQHKEKELRDAIHCVRRAIEKSSKKRTKEADITREEYEEVFRRKAELYGEFTRRYALSPTTLGKFFDIAELEAKYLKKIKKKADEILKAKQGMGRNEKQNKTYDNGMCKDTSIDSLIKSLTGLIAKLDMPQEEVVKIKLLSNGDKVYEEITKILKTATSKISEKEKERDALIEQKERRLQERERELAKREAEVHLKTLEVNNQLKKCEEWKSIHMKEKAQFSHYKERAKEKLKIEEAKLKRDWEKLKILEADLMNKPSARVRSESKKAPESARRLKPQPLPLVPAHVNSNRRGAVRKSMDLFAAKNKENCCNNAESTAKFS
eukprot:TRINITY_DN91_c1_g1_i3.p3 TRINITY_DN91_c1_g1~~TRINITY_DN91_c1_g1_i3.p3  ORF type:complete len:464 (-),score=58.90 TRINITY_DN91_c1_g1_i3:3169-4560(-)